MDRRARREALPVAGDAMTALLALPVAALLGVLAGLRIARWAARDHVTDLHVERWRLSDRLGLAWRHLDIAREDAARWRRRALRLGWRPRPQRPSVVDARGCR